MIKSVCTAGTIRIWFILIPNTTTGAITLTICRKCFRSPGIEFRPRTSREVFDKLVSTEENKYIIKLVKLVCTFLHGFKTNGFTIDISSVQSKSLQ